MLTKFILLTCVSKILEKLYLDYKDKGFYVLDFPCNQFAYQAPGTDEEINNYCVTSFNTTFPRFKKIEFCF